MLNSRCGPVRAKTLLRPILLTTAVDKNNTQNKSTLAQYIMYVIKIMQTIGVIRRQRPNWRVTLVLISNSSFTFMVFETSSELLDVFTFL